MEFTCTNCGTVNEVVIPTKAKSLSGSLAGIALEDMTIEQLKQEKRNAKSVLYKSEKAGRPVESLIPKQERVDAVEAMLALRVAAAKPEEVVTEVAEATECTDEVCEAPTEV
jgi:hypothetical protein